MNTASASSRSKRSSASQPEFFVDRCLGKGAPRLLRDGGWLLHEVTDHFMNDAQEISDPAWIEFGLARGWSLLTQDKRIRTQAEALALLTRYAGSIFCLSSGELPIATRAARFDTHRAIIDGFTARNAGFFVVYENGVVRRWP